MHPATRVLRDTRRARPAPQPRPGEPSHGQDSEQGTGAGMPLYLQNRNTSAEGDSSSEPEYSPSVPEGVHGVPSAETPSTQPVPAASTSGNASTSTDEVLWSEADEPLASYPEPNASVDPGAADSTTLTTIGRARGGRVTTSAPGEALEGEADRAADQAMADSAARRSSAGGAGAPGLPGAPAGREDDALQMSVPDPEPVPASVAPGERISGPEARQDAVPAEDAAPAVTPAAPSPAASIVQESGVGADVASELVEAAAEELASEAMDAPAGPAVSDVPDAAAEAAADSEPEEDEEGPSAADLASPRGGGGAPGLGAWRAQVDAATDAIPQPDPGDPATIAAPIAESAGGAAARHQAEAAAVPGEGKAQLPEKKEEVPETPPDTRPVPEARKLVDDAASRKLDDQLPPDFERSPQGFMPVMGQSPISPDDLRKLVETPPAFVSDPNDPEATRLEELRLALLEPQLTPEQAAGKAVPVADVRPPPPPALPADTVVDISKVLAHLLADPQAEARGMLRRVRSAYANGALQTEFPSLGDDDLGPALATELERQVRGIAAEAGVAADVLETAVTNRRSVLEERRRVAEAEVASTTQMYSEQLQSAGQSEMDAIAGTKQQLDAAADQADAAASAADPEAIEKQRDQLIDDVTARAGTGSAQIRQAGEKRQTDLDRASTGQGAAYRAAAQQDELRLRTTAGGGDPKITEDLVAESRAWATRKSEEAGTAIRALKKDATKNTERLQAGLETAADDAREQIRAWADEQTGERRSWWDRLMDWIGDWTRQARANAEAWAKVRNQRAARTLAGDLQQVQSLQAAAEQGLDAEAYTGGRQLSEQQQAVVDSFFGKGADKGDPLAAIAAGTRARILGERRGELTTQLEDRLVKPDVDADALERVAQAINPGFSAARIASDCHNAMFGGVTGWGTDEGQIFSALAGLSRLEGVAVRRMYTQEYDGRNLDSDLKSELSGAEEDRALAQLRGDSARAVAAELYEAMDGAGTDEATIMAALRGKSAEEREQIRKAYLEIYKADLDADLKSEMSGLELDRAEALAAGDVAKADAIELQDAMKGVGTDEKALEGVYSRIRDEVHRQAQAEGWTSAQMEAEIRRRGGEVEGKFNKEFSKYWGTSEKGSALRTAFADEMDPGPQRELVNALADNDMTRADAARLAVERDSFVTDDEVVNGVLRSQYDRALQATRLDHGPKLRAALDEEERKLGRPMDPYERKRREREIERQLESMAQVQANQNMAALEKTYDTKFSSWGPGSLRTMIEYNTSGTEREKARDLLAQGGRLSAAQEIRYAVRGAGTDEEAIKKALAGRSPEEVQKIREEYARLSGGEKMDDRLKSELDGRDLHETKLALRGEPGTPEEELAQMRERLQYERENTGTFFGLAKPGTLGGSAELKRMERRANKMEAAYAAVNEPGIDDKERVRRLQTFQQYTGQVRVSTDEVKRQAEAVADAVSTAAGVVAAVVVIVAASIVTGGGAAAVGIPALMSALGSGGVAAASAAVSVAATILTKRAILGSSYGGEQIGIDIAVGVVDAAASYATAGFGGALLKAAKGAPVGRLAKMAASSSRATRMLAHGLAEGAEGFVSTLPSALAGNVLNDDNWRHGNAALNILGGTAFETGLGTVLSGGMGAAGGWTKQIDAPKVRETGDVLAHRGTPRERAAQFAAFRAENPGASYRDWVRDFDAGVVAKREAADAERQLQRQLRTELLSGMPEKERRQFAGAAIEILDDAEFQRRFGSKRGQAVTLIENGKPRVVMRESADPKVLREEGIHMLQTVDPKTRAAVSRLDEKRLANWKKMDLGEQLSLYRTKMELEIDAHERLVRGLEDDLASAGDDAARRELLGRMDEAADTLDTLRGRVREVDAITPDRRLAMQADPKLRPQYLEEPARLFSKAAPKELLPTIASAKALREHVIGTFTSKADVALAKGVFRRLDMVSTEPKYARTFLAVAKMASDLAEVDPARARAYLQSVQALVATRNEAKEISGFLRASARAGDPAGFLDQAARLAARKDLPIRNLGELANRVQRLAPADGAALMNGAEAMLATRPSNGKELGQLLSSVLGSANPQATLDAVRAVLGRSRAPGDVLPREALHDMAEAIGRLKHGRDLDFLARVDRVLDARVRAGQNAGDLAGFIRGVRHQADPVAYMDLVERLAGRKLEPAALRDLASKASNEDGLDLDYLLNRTTLSDDQLNWLAMDSQTPWRGFRDASAAVVGSDQWKGAQRKLRGIAGEWTTDILSPTLFGAMPGFATPVRSTRQHTFKTKRMIDFVFEGPAGSRTGVEVKAWTDEMWRDILKAYDRIEAAGGPAGFTEGEKLLWKKIQTLKGQLGDAHAQFGTSPVVVISNGIKGPRRTRIMALMATELPFARLVEIPDANVKALKDVLRTLLAIP